jgi:hypothetical protein
MIMERRYTRLSEKLRSERKKDGFRGGRSRQYARTRDDDRPGGAMTNVAVTAG